MREFTVFLGWVGVVCVDFWLFVGGFGVKPSGAGAGVHRGRRYTNAHTSNTKKVTETGRRK